MNRSFFMLYGPAGPLGSPEPQGLVPRMVVFGSGPDTAARCKGSCQAGWAAGCYQAMSNAPFSSIGSSVNCPVLSSILPRFPE